MPPGSTAEIERVNQLFQGQDFTGTQAADEFHWNCFDQLPLQRPLAGAVAARVCALARRECDTIGEMGITTHFELVLQG